MTNPSNLNNQKEVTHSIADTIPIPITYSSNTKDSDDNANNQSGTYQDTNFDLPSNKNYE